MANYTVRDIARMVGVSVGTVSRVLNNADNVDPEIHRRTMEVVKATNYKQGNRGWRPGQRRSGKSKTVSCRTLAVVFAGNTPEWKTNALSLSYMSGVEQACRERHYNMIAYMGGSYGSSKEMFADIAQRSAGILLKVSSNSSEELEGLSNLLPTVGFGFYNPLFKIPQVALDNHSAGVIATEKLLRAGHRRIAFVNNEQYNSMFVSRAQGYMQVMMREGLFDQKFMLQSGEKHSENITAPLKSPLPMNLELEKLLNMPEPPTAIVFANDWMAFGFYKACAESGIAIPDQFSVVGIDDAGSLGEMLSPTLTTMAMPFEQVACFAAGMLIDMMEGAGAFRRGVASVQYISGEFQQRNSMKSLL